MLTINTRLPKTCFARAGEIICLVDEKGNVIDDPFLVCVLTLDSIAPKKIVASNGLYSAEEDYYLVNLRTGLPRKMPHLSSRINILRDAFLSYELTQ